MSQNMIRIQRERSTVDTLLRLSDAACVLMGFVAVAQYPRANVDAAFWCAAAFTIVVMFLLGELSGLYRHWRGVATHREIAAAMLEPWSAPGGGFPDPLHGSLSPRGNAIGVS